MQNTPQPVFLKNLLKEFLSNQHSLNHKNIYHQIIVYPFKNENKFCHNFVQAMT